MPALMGGFLGVATKQGAGSIFWFDLPLEVPTAASAMSVSPSMPSEVGAALRSPKRTLLFRSAHKVLDHSKDNMKIIVAEVCGREDSSAL
jgi:hypothetical protein